MFACHLGTLRGVGKLYTSMSHKDEYYNKAKQENYRARSAYKLQQIDDIADILSGGNTVVDLGAAPGGWLQVAADRVGPSGRVLGVDKQRIDPIDHENRNVSTIRGDITDERTIDRITDEVGDVDAVISDMAPNMTGEYDLDHARSVHLARQALAVAMAVLAPGGDLVAKVFQGRDLDGLRSDVDDPFEYVRTISPDASRDSSSEVFLVGKRRINAPVTEGETLTVDVTAMGEEGDGIATVDGYTLFVPNTEIGDTVTVVVDSVKPGYGFTERQP